MSQDTLCCLRQFWHQYSEMANLSARQRISSEEKIREAIKSTYRKNIGDNVLPTHGFRSAAVHWARAMPVLSSCFQKFWETGVVAGNSMDVHNLEVDGHGRVNPLFALSSAPNGKFAVHYGTDPLLGFHLASAFDDETCSEWDLKNKIVGLAKTQFSEWCTTFKEQVHANTLSIRVFCGEALRFCHALQAVHTSTYQIPKIVRAYTYPWDSTELVLQTIDSSGDSSLYDIIDTSNLIDHVGMLNVLPAVIPLLAHRITSVLYTNGMLRAAEDTTTTLSALLCSDVATMSLIFGLTPTAQLLPYTVDAVGIEAAVDLITPKKVGRRGQYCVSIAWRIPNFGDCFQVQEGLYPCRQLTCEPQQLAKYFYKLYLTMFSYEDMSLMMGSLMRQEKSPLAVDLRLYNRMTFVSLLFLAKNHVYTDWSPFIKHLLNMIQADTTLLVGRNSLQELYVLLHLFGLFTIDVLRQPPRSVGRTPYGQPRPRVADSGLLGREGLPPVVYVALTVPRHKLEVFTKDGDPRGTPGLHVSISNIEQGFDNSFYAIQCFFGQLRTRNNDHTICDVISDNRRWQGTADLIVTCAVPTWSLLLGPKEGTRIALAVSTTPFTSHYIPQLGLHLSVYECGLDSHNLQILSRPPGVTSWPQSATIEQTISSEREACIVHLDKDPCAHTLQVRKASNAAVTCGTNFKVMQISPCTMTVKIENFDDMQICYPFPVDGEQQKTTMKSGAVEMTVPIASALSSGGYKHNPFPLYMCREQVTPLLISRLNLDRQPEIRAAGNLDWLTQFMGWTLSGKERASYVKSSTETRDVLLQLKSSVNSLLQSFMGLGPHGQMEVFQLTCKHKKDSSDTLIFASALRHNIPQRSILLDAFVVPLTKERVSKLAEALKFLVMAGKILSVMIKSREEEILWKKLLPVQVECCRQVWHHGEGCEYRLQGRIPLSTEHSALPICACGENHDIDRFPRIRNWETFAKYATRIAIMPLSAIPYIESSFVTNEQKREFQSQRRAPVSEKCDNCGKHDVRLKKCLRCGIASYCNRECQKAAWKTHKKDCKKGRTGSF
jgi:MYND finger